MKIINTKELAIPAIKVITHGRFTDHRGYFTETFRKDDFNNLREVIGDWEILQSNESFSKKHTLRGLHFQWNPYMGKLVRTIQGHMIDIVLDIRKNSPTFGKAIMYDMPSSPEDDSAEWIWVPPGFAHGNFFLLDTTIEYYCSGQYSSGNEAGISPLSNEIDWSLCDNELNDEFKKTVSAESLLITDKDKDGYSLSAWSATEESEKFVYANLQ